MANPPPSVATAETLPPVVSSGRNLPLKSSLHHTGGSVQPISHNHRQERKDEQSKPNDIDSVTELRSLFGFLSGHLIQYPELHEHLNVISNFIDTKLSQSSLPYQTQPSKKVKSVGRSVKQEKTPEESSLIKVEAPCDNLEATDDKVWPPLTEVEHLCKTMAGRGLRRYIVTHLDDISKLLEDVPAALRLANYPAKMVLDCLGGFYIQSFRAFTGNSKMVPSRQASIFALECFLRMGFNDDQIDPASRTQAHEAAIIWRDRLNKEGGVSKACEWDARGLLLLICCFGLPKSFKNDDIKSLVKGIKTREIDDLLRKSAVLAKRIPGIIGGMLKNGMEVEAMDLVYTFGMEDRFFPQTILTSFLKESDTKWKKTKFAAHISLEVLNQANIKHLSDLKSVQNLLEDHKIDPLNLLPSWEIKDTIASLAKEISDADKKMSKMAMPIMPKPKRRVEENELANYLENKELKRLRLTGPLLQQHNNVSSFPGPLLHQHNNVSSSSSSTTYPGMRIAIDKNPHIYYSPSAIPHSANAVVANNAADLMGHGDVNLLVDRYLRMGDNRETLASYGEPAVFRGNVPPAPPPPPPYEIAASRLQQGHGGLAVLANPSRLVSSTLNDHPIYHQYGNIGNSRLSRGGFGVEPQNMVRTIDNGLLSRQNVSNNGQVLPFAGSAYGSSSSSYLY